MAIVWQQSVPALAGGAGTSLAGTFSPAVGPGQTIALVFGWGDNTADTCTITDNASNTYVQQLLPISVNAEYWGIAYCLNALGAPTTITLTTALSHSTMAMMIDVYAGISTFFASSEIATTVGVITTPSLTPPVNGCLAYGGAVSTTGGNCNAHSGSGFTPRINNFSTAFATAELIQAIAAPVSAVFDIGGTGIAFEMVFTPAVPVSSQSQGSAGGSILRVVRTIGYASQ